MDVVTKTVHAKPPPAGWTLLSLFTPSLLVTGTEQTSTTSHLKRQQARNPGIVIRREHLSA